MFFHNRKEGLQMQIELMKFQMFKCNQIKTQVHRPINSKEEEIQILIKITFRNLQDQINNSLFFPIQILMDKIKM
jgi:hypothetical protein